MDDPARVGVAEPSQHLIDHRPDDRPRQQAVHLGAVDPLVQRAARRHVHHQVRRTVGQHAVVAGANDGRMVQACERARLLVEEPRVVVARLLGAALVGALVHVARAAARLHPRVRHQLERYPLVVHQIAAQVHEPHATATELAADLVATGQDRPNRKRCFTWRGHGEAPRLTTLAFSCTPTRVAGAEAGPAAGGAD